MDKFIEGTGSTTIAQLTKCPICGHFFKGDGNNTEPVIKKGRCCDACNKNVVIPTRIFINEKIKNARGEIND